LSGHEVRPADRLESYKRCRPRGSGDPPPTDSRFRGNDVALDGAENMDLREQLLSAAQGNVVVMGIGNPCRGDDAAGSRVAREIAERPGVRVIDAQDVPEDYLSKVEACQPDTVVLIDSVDLGSAPGSAAFFDQDRTTGYYPSTHRVPLQLIVSYLERTTHARIFLLAIQPRQTGFLQAMSVEVSSSVEAITGVFNDVLRTRSAPAQVDFASSGKGVVPA